MVKKLSKLYFFIAICLMAGCSIKYGNQNPEVTKSETIPDSVMKNFKLVQIKNNNIYTEIESSLTEIYDKQNKTLLYDVNFKEFDDKGKSINTEGSVNKIEYFNDTESAKLTGALNFRSSKEKISLTGESLEWDKEEKLISTEIDDPIKIVKDDGSEIEGYGFNANLTNSTFSFKKNVRGVSN